MLSFRIVVRRVEGQFAVLLFRAYECNVGAVIGKTKAQAWSAHTGMGVLAAAFAQTSIHVLPVPFDQTHRREGSVPRLRRRFHSAFLLLLLAVIGMGPTLLHPRGFAITVPLTLAKRVMRAMPE